MQVIIRCKTIHFYNDPITIQEMEDIHSQEVEKYFGKIQELERSKELLSLDHQQKVVYLETVVDDKSKRIDHLETEKK